jgi:hypothetical protein
MDSGGWMEGGQLQGDLLWKIYWNPVHKKMEKEGAGGRREERG